MSAQKRKFPYLLGSKWTAKQNTWGWRHFQVVNRQDRGKWVFAEMVASCDAKVRFWINAQQLKDRSLWQAGWKSLEEINQSDRGVAKAYARSRRELDLT
ncbi:MAG: TIGR02450 family Trp-rich protein [Prochloraceae cyanobacterium]